MVFTGRTNGIVGFVTKQLIMIYLLNMLCTRKNVPDTRVNLDSACIRSGHATYRTTAPCLMKIVVWYNLIYIMLSLGSIEIDHVISETVIHRLSTTEL